MLFKQHLILIILFKQHLILIRHRLDLDVGAHLVFRHRLNGV
jgi:hypothetical protein